MTFKMNILASDKAQYLDAYDVKTERTCLNTAQNNHSYKE